MDCKHVQDRLSDYLDQALPETESSEIRHHVQRCRACDQELRMLRIIGEESASLEKVRAPDAIWPRIEAELEHPLSFIAAISAKWRRFNRGLRERLAVPAPVWQMAGVAAVLVIGIILGRSLFLPHAPDRTATGFAENGNMKLVEARAADYIAKSQVLFLALVNSDDADIKHMDLRPEQHIAENLIREASFLKENLSRTRDARLQALVEELELILFEIANMEQQEDIEAVDLIKSGIEQNDLLLKINLYEMNEPSSQEKTDAGI